MTAKKANLEDVFLELTEKAEHSPVQAGNIAPDKTNEEAGDDESEVKS